MTAGRPMHYVMPFETGPCSSSARILLWRCTHDVFRLHIGLLSSQSIHLAFERLQMYGPFRPLTVDTSAVPVSTRFLRATLIVSNNSSSTPPS